LEKFSSLLNDLKLSQISTMTDLVYQKLKIIDLLESTSIDYKNKEKDVHKIFEKNTWLLGKTYEIVSSDKSLTEYLEKNIKEDPETKVRPDIIARILPHSQDIVIVEFKKPGIKLKTKHIGQVLEYKALIKNLKPNVQNISCFLFGTEKDVTFFESADVKIKTFSEIVSELKYEYSEYQKILEIGNDL